jgi:hypothetical protein
MRMFHCNANSARIGVCLSVVLLMGCSGHYSAPPLPDLHMPGVTEIRGLDAVQRNRHIGFVTAYLPGGSQGARILFSADGLFSVGMDGTDLHEIKHPPPCDGPFAVTRDGKWAACADWAGIARIALDLAPQTDYWQLNIGPNMGTLRKPSWSPDGHALAAIIRPISAGCYVGLYQVSDDVKSGRLITLLSFPTFAGPNPTQPHCELISTSWSPDGEWLAVVASGWQDRIYVMSLAMPLRQSLGADSPDVIKVTRQDLLLVGLTQSSAPPTWSISGGKPAVTFVSTDRSSIVQADPETAIETPLLTITSHQICAVDATPDGARFVILQCSPGNPDVEPPQSKLYVYTPPTPGA